MGVIYARLPTSLHKYLYISVKFVHVMYFFKIFSIQNCKTLISSISDQRLLEINQSLLEVQELLCFSIAILRVTALFTLIQTLSLPIHQLEPSISLISSRHLPTVVDLMAAWHEDRYPAFWNLS